MLRRLRRQGLTLFRQVQRDDVIGMSAELAYRWFLSLFPFAIFLAGLGAFVGRALDVRNPAQVAKDQLTGLLPEEAATLIGEELQRIIESQNAGLLSFGMIAAIWFATGGTNAVIKAMNRAFDVGETRPLWRRYVVALALTVAAGAALLTAFILFVVGQVVAVDVAAELGISGAAWTVVTLLRWPVAAVLMFLAVAAIYRFGPNIRLRWRWIVPGAIVFTLGWLATTFAFGWYVSNFGSYGATFGALAGVAILMIWFYLTAAILLLGAEINDVLAEHDEPAAVEARRSEAAVADGGDRRARPGLQRPAAGA